ncbi:hypothetical protein PG991_013730 [Apiospora marii]|uniref:Uncharacterized protein n=1 Tax=Apiospora marii TaxID=335849 RepID=A0ABR1R705_9PEZI
MADAAYVNFFGSEDCNSYTKTVNIPTGCSNVGASALSWEIFGSGCTVSVYANADCQGFLSPSQTNPNKCYDSSVQIRSVKATC